mmetsp:Transcript_11790/g.43802  ORF Transcript_11790/g.43802 Transcript_11790/m.43802 type:complete len:246 (+) Transcript_11790:624-1361(+)
MKSPTPIALTVLPMVAMLTNLPACFKNAPASCLNREFASSYTTGRVPYAFVRLYQHISPTRSPFWETRGLSSPKTPDRINIRAFAFLSLLNASPNPATLGIAVIFSALRRNRRRYVREEGESVSSAAAAFVGIFVCAESSFAAGSLPKSDPTSLSSPVSSSVLSFRAMNSRSSSLSLFALDPKRNPGRNAGDTEGDTFAFANRRASCFFFDRQIDARLIIACSSGSKTMSGNSALPMGSSALHWS